VRTLGKRLLIVSILGAAIGIGADLWQAAMPSANPPPTAAQWKLSAPADCGRPLKVEIESWPGISGARRVCRATYVGPSKVRLTLFDMPEWPGATAFGAFQKWLSSGPGNMGFMKGRYFGVVDSPQSDSAGLERFRVSIEGTLPGKSENHWYRMSSSEGPKTP
jgi:hypothetical protein